MQTDEVLRPIYDMLVKQNAPVVSLRFVHNVNANAASRFTYHGMGGRLVRAEWGETPSLGCLAALNAALTDSGKNKAIVLSRLAQLDEKELEDAFAEIVTHYLQAHPSLAQKLGVSFD